MSSKNVEGNDQNAEAQVSYIGTSASAAQDMELALIEWYLRPAVNGELHNPV